MKLQNVNNQPSFKAAWYHLPKKSCESQERAASYKQVLDGKPIPQADIPHFIWDLTANFATGRIQHSPEDVASDIYTGKTVFRIGDIHIVLVNSPVELKNGKKLPPWAIFIHHQLPQGGITGIFRNAEGMADVEFDALKGLLLYVLRKTT